MARVAGIQFTKTSAGKLKSVTFDLKKHGQKVLPLLQEMGVLNEDAFEKEWSESINGNELRLKVKDRIKSLPWKKP